MSKNSNQIMRQWLIVLFLLENDRYVSSDDVLNFLQEQQVAVTDRTVQRDLATLLEVFPVECRKDNKPYSYRWKRIIDVKTNHLSYEQALLLFLVSQELKSVIPKDLFERLYPLFFKAKLILAGEDVRQSHSKENIISLLKEAFSGGGGGFGGPFGPVGNVPTGYNFKRSLEKLTQMIPFFQKEEADPWQYMVQKQDILELQSVLKEQGLDSMAQLLSGLEKKLKSPK